MSDSLILVPGGATSAVPQMQKILHMYHAEGLYNHEFAPFLNGYIGEHAEFYQPGTKQLAGPGVYPSHPVMSIHEYYYYLSSSFRVLNSM